MAIEIERKYLVKDNSFKALAVEIKEISQGYISSTSKSVVRVRIANQKAFLTLKSKTYGFTRNEWEYEIPMEDARQMLTLCLASLEKTRYIVPFEGYNWEIDVFHGLNEGIVVAEIELPSEDAQFNLPPFIGEEVTGNPAYYNSNLAKRKIEDNI